MTADELKTQYQQEEDQVIALQAEKDARLQAVWDEFRPQLQEAQGRLRDLQQQWLDAQSAEALMGRDDADALAASLGLTDALAAARGLTSPE